jgi:hypothetical protein
MICYPGMADDILPASDRPGPGEGKGERIARTRPQGIILV